MDRRNAGEAARARVDGQAREKAIHDKAAALRAVRAADDKGTPGWRMSVLGRRLKDRLPAALAADDDGYTVLVNRRNKIADTMRRRFGDRLTDSPPRYDQHVARLAARRAARAPAATPATSKNPALEAAMNKHSDRVQSALAAAPAAGPRPPALRRLYAIGVRANNRLEAARPAGPPRSRAEAQVETARKEAMAMSQRLMNPVDQSLAGYEDAYAKQLRKRLTELRSARSKA